jgi:hypothetical protein
VTVRLLRSLAALPVCVVVVAGGVGWLALLRGVPVLDVGPRVPGSLPLQRLAGGDAQPLLRVLVAWLSAGLVMGAVLASAGRLGRLARAAAVPLIGGLTLVALGALQDGITASEAPLAHVLPQLSHEGLWVAVAALTACALIPGSPARTAAAAADARHRREDEGAAAGRTPRPA